MRTGELPVPDFLTRPTWLDRRFKGVPIYEYQCLKCGERLEVFQKISEKPVSRCKLCGGKVEKLVSQTHFQLKGSGWYLTDYARKSQPSDKPGDSESKPAQKSEKGGETGGKSSTPSGDSQTGRTETKRGSAPPHGASQEK